MSDNTTATLKSLLASQKHQLKTQVIIHEKLLQIEASQARCEATLARIEADIAEILAHIKNEDQDQSTFAELVRAGEEDVGQLNDYISAYNEGERTEPLHEALGLTAEELVALLERPQDADEILGITDAP